METVPLKLSPNLLHQLQMTKKRNPRRRRNGRHLRSGIDLGQGTEIKNATGHVLDADRGRGHAASDLAPAGDLAPGTERDHALETARDRDLEIESGRALVTERSLDLETENVPGLAIGNVPVRAIENALVRVADDLRVVLIGTPKRHTTGGPVSAAPTLQLSKKKTLQL